jgi:hypothetical protein
MGTNVRFANYNLELASHLFRFKFGKRIKDMAGWEAYRGWDLQLSDFPSTTKGDSQSLSENIEFLPRQDSKSKAAMSF